MLRTLIALILLLCFAGQTVGAAASRAPRQVTLTPEERAWLDRNPEKLTLHYNTEFPPLEFAAPDGTFTGLGADLIARIEDLLDITFIKTPSDDWNRHLADLASGACAVAPTIVLTEERQKFAFFTGTYAAAPVGVITRRGNRLGGSLAGRQVAVVSGFATEEYAHAMAEGQFEIRPVRNVAAGLRMVAFGQQDAFLENLAVAAYYIDQEGLPNLRVAWKTDLEFAWRIGVSREYPLLYNAIVKALAGIPPEELAAMRARWLALETPGRLNAQTLRMFKMAAWFTLVLVAALVLITILLKRRLHKQVIELRRSRKQLLEQTAHLERTLREKETLLRELYHRTKNNMQVIRSLLALQAAGTENAEVTKALRETENRIQAMALVHQKLYQARDLSRIDLRDYLEDLFRLLLRSYKIADAEVEFSLEIPDIRVLIDIAIPCGLIVNELVSNSLKYAFPDGRQGKLTLRIERPEPDSLEMHYADDGIGVPPNFDFRRCKTLGLQSIFAIAEHQLQGSVEFQSNGGLQCRIRFADIAYRERI